MLVEDSVPDCLCRLHRKNIEAYLKAADILTSLGYLTAADRVLDKVRPMTALCHRIAGEGVGV